MVEQYPTRGYLSTVDNRLHFGFGTGGIDSIKIVWPDRKQQIIQHPTLNGVLKVNYKNAVIVNDAPKTQRDTIFTDVTQQIKVDFQHKETSFFDYGFEPLIPQKYSQEGPFISTGDVNGDGLEDFFIGGAYKQSGKVFLQQHDGSFVGKDLVTGTKNEEDMQSALFDADGDGDLDLLLVSGSSEFDVHSSFYRPRLYLNDGKGNFLLDATAMSTLVRTPGKAIAVADMDGDGDLDVFIGGRVSLGTYPVPPQSYILRNDHGKFTDVTGTVCPALETIGLINAAAWVDIDNDKKPDLIIAGDWMPIRIFKNNGITLTEITAQTGLDSLPGFWRSISITDIDHDGDLDIVAGNIGLNNPYHISQQQPAQLIAKDFDGNGVVEPIFCYYIKDNTGKYKLSAGISREEWATQMPSIKDLFERNSAYANATLEQVFPKEMMDNATVLTCKEARSGYFENNGKGVFTFHPFPTQTQEAPVNTILATDVNGDGNSDIILAGNEYQSKVSAGRYDASYGLLLTGDGKGGLTAVPPTTSGLIIDGDVRDLKLVNVGKQRLLLSAINNAKMKVYGIKK
jgi:hypothetical protein